MVLVLGGLFTACGVRKPADDIDAGGTGGGSGSGIAQPPEAMWLKKIGVGSTQTARVCARGATDLVARALCGTPSRTLGGLDDLYRALGLGTPSSERMVATATHSVGLSARTVSALNPRTFVFHSYGSLTLDTIVAVAFARGETFVELVGFDPATYDFNFYLLSFEPACAAGVRGCLPSDLLTAKVERDWSDWTLYGDVDLEDTGLDCLSCHRPDGAGAPKRLLMRQMNDPWMHWGDFRGVKGPVFCTDANGGDVTANGTVSADGLDLLARIEGADGHHAAVPIAEVTAAHGGYDLASFIFYAAGDADGPGDVPCQAPACAFSEPNVFESGGVICDRLLYGSADAVGGTWERYRREMLSRGFPVPYHGPDVLDPAKRVEATPDARAYLQRTLDQNAGADAFTVASDLVGDDAARAIGVVSSEGDAAPQILRQMCVRCHSDSTDARLVRARFNVDRPGAWTPDVRRKVLDRLMLPPNSPDIMPPRRAGTLPSWAINSVGRYLQEFPQAGP
jgi:hypothetical protein